MTLRSLVDKALTDDRLAIINAGAFNLRGAMGYCHHWRTGIVEALLAEQAKAPDDLEPGLLEDLQYVLKAVENDGWADAPGSSSIGTKCVAILRKHINAAGQHCDSCDTDMPIGCKGNYQSLPGCLWMAANSPAAPSPAPSATDLTPLSKAELAARKPFPLKYDPAAPSATPEYEDIARLMERRNCAGWATILRNLVSELAVLREANKQLHAHGKDLYQRAIAAEAERDLAISHDRQPYPTAWAYEQVCKSLDAAKAEIEQLRAKPGLRPPFIES